MPRVFIHVTNEARFLSTRCACVCVYEKIIGTIFTDSPLFFLLKILYLFIYKRETSDSKKRSSGESRGGNAAFNPMIRGSGTTTSFGSSVSLTFFFFPINCVAKGRGRDEMCKRAHVSTLACNLQIQHVRYTLFITNACAGT